MLKKTLLLPVVLASIISCKKEETQKTLPAQSTVTQTNIETRIQEIQNTSAIETVKTFFKWYRDNEDKLDAFAIVKGGIMAESDDNINYYIDFNEVEKEMKFLENTSLFSADFLNAYKKRYTEGDKYFRKNPANDGPPVNFDYNYFFLTQEDYQADLKNIDQIQFTIQPINGRQCYVECYLQHCGMKLKYTLTKKDQWMIDSIENIS